MKNSWNLVPFESLYAEPSRNGLMRPKRVRGEGYPMINMGELFAYERIDGQPMDVVPMSEDEIGKYSVRSGDLLFARQSLVAEGTGKCSVVLRVREITTFESHLIRVRLDRKKAEPLFFYYYFSSSAGKANVQSIMMQVAAAGIRASELALLRVPEPPLAVQTTIATILSVYDDLIENNRRRIKVLEEMARAVYREWFVELRFPGHAKVKLVESELGKIPQGWELRDLKDVARVTYGFPFDSKGFNAAGKGEPVIRIRDILNGRSPTFTDEEVESKYRIKNGDILIGMDGEFHMCIWAGGPALQNQRVARFESRGDIGIYHLFLALERPIKELNQAIVGTTVAHLGDMHIKAIKLVWPPFGLLTTIREMLEPISEEIIVLKRQLSNLRDTRDLLLPRLISGEVNVEDLKIETVMGEVAEAVK